MHVPETWMNEVKKKNRKNNKMNEPTDNKR